MGTAYLICFDRPYRHARHYLGWTGSHSLRRRLDRHAAGNGARLLAVLRAAGIGWRLVRIWRDVDRSFERRLKGHSSSRYCPHCRPGLQVRKPKEYRCPSVCGSACP